LNTADNKFYDAPVDELGKPYYVPVVVKNHDYLLAYLNGVSYMQMVSDMIFKSLKLPINVTGFDLNLDSSKYNDILPSGNRASELSDNELKKIINKKIEEKLEFEESRNTNSENKPDILEPAFFTIDCNNCGGYYAFKSVEEIPKETFTCGICGRILIHYTGHHEYEYQYDQRKS